MPGLLSFVTQLIKGLEIRFMTSYGTITAVETGEPLVALTFDDGPDPEYTPQLLKILELHGARATFFVVGEHARRYPDLLAQIAHAGHAIANHTWSHPGLPLISLVQQRQQIQACAEAISPHGTALFRPPYGAQKRLTYLNIRSLGYEVVTWSLMVGDWEYKSADEMFETMAHGTRPGSIILLHDKLIGAEDSRAYDRGPTFTAVDRLLDYFAGHMSFVTVPELLRSGRPVRTSWVKREVP